jgi:hypothetical protein
MKPNTYTKAKENITKIRKHLYENYKINENILYKDIEIFMNNNNIHGMNFYYLVYSKCCVLVKRGVYKIMPQMFIMQIDKIIELSNIVIKEKKYTKLAKKNNAKFFTPTLFRKEKEIEKQGETLTEESCIAFLKQLGYKILKQINKYEEI